MKLGAALVRRKYLATLVPQLTAKLAAAVVVIEGAPVLESDDKAEALKRSLDTTLAELNHLIVSINHTNNRTALPGGQTVMEAIARRDFLKLAVAQYQAVMPKIRPRTERGYDKTDPVTVYVVAEGIDPVAIKAQLNHYSQEYRELDEALQSMNWTVELIEQ